VRRRAPVSSVEAMTHVGPAGEDVYSPGKLTIPLPK
jgi:hypothetical protein